MAIIKTKSLSKDMAQCVWNAKAGLCHTDICPFKAQEAECNNHAPSHGCVWLAAESSCKRDTVSPQSCSARTTVEDCLYDEVVDVNVYV